MDESRKRRDGAIKVDDDDWRFCDNLINLIKQIKEF